MIRVSLDDDLVSAGRKWFRFERAVRSHVEGIEMFDIPAIEVEIQRAIACILAIHMHNQSVDFQACRNHHVTRDRLALCSQQADRFGLVLREFDPLPVEKGELLSLACTFTNNVQQSITRHQILSGRQCSNRQRIAIFQATVSNSRVLVIAKIIATTVFGLGLSVDTLDVDPRLCFCAGHVVLDAQAGGCCWLVGWR